MEKTMLLKNEYSSLDVLHNFLKETSSFESFKEYDTWDVRTDSNGQIAQCIVLKKSGMHAVKLYFTKPNEVKITCIIPSKIMHAYFGKSVKARQNSIEVLTGKLKELLLAPTQQKVFKELEAELQKIAA